MKTHRFPVLCSDCDKEEELCSLTIDAWKNIFRRIFNFSQYLQNFLFFLIFFYHFHFKLKKFRIKRIWQWFFSYFFFPGHCSFLDERNCWATELVEKNNEPIEDCYLGRRKLSGWSFSFHRKIFAEAWKLGCGEKLSLAFNCSANNSQASEAIKKQPIMCC